MDEAVRVFDGLKVLDVATYIAGPAAATILSDFGAEVTKVEAPAGDPYRYMSGAPGLPQHEANYSWIVDARNKRSITLDLKNAEAREVLHRLVAETDVFVTNLPFPVRERLGIRYDDLASLNDRLIYASLTAYGEHGPEADRTGFDSTVWWARTGLMDLVRGGPDAAPVRSLPGMGDHPTAMALYGAIVTALYRREKTGRGGNVSSSLLANGAWSNAVFLQAMLCGATIEVRPPRAEAANALTNVYRTRDDRWFIMILLGDERQWSALLGAVGREDLGDDPRFASEAGRMENAPALTAAFDEVFAGLDWADVLARLRAAGLPFGIVGQAAELADDVQMREGRVFVPRQADDGGPSLTIDSPFWLEDEVKVVPAAAPELGAHTEDVLSAAGYDSDEIARLRNAGALG